MAQGKLSDTNLLATAALAGGTWHGVYNLAQLQTEKDYISAPARCTDRTDLAKSQFTATWTEPQVISLVGLLFHTMSLSAKYRLTFLAEDLVTPVLDTGWQFVFPSVYDPSELELNAENCFTGTLTSAEIDLYPRHRWISPAEALAWALRVELDDTAAGAGVLDLGGCWVASGWSPVNNFERGRNLSVQPRDLVDEAASGKLFPEERQPRRELSIAYEMLKDDEALRFVDTGLRVRTTRTVIFIPDTDDEALMMREAFPAVLAQLPPATFTYPGLNKTAFSLREILA